ncbi:uncharacterized protein LOC128231640 [Mya arenaria]|uniref:uncharacterized protein LOC128231640 n=1 Tax=Mya arenaria TaxID=6604 RepID=UPI0022E9405C|nr:uncharacterized protein LOC128231640 [Mya arenaria]
MLRVLCLGLVVFAALTVTLVTSEEKWIGNIDAKYGWHYIKVWYCRSWYYPPHQCGPSGCDRIHSCGQTSYYDRAVYGWSYSCQPGWTTSTPRNCDIPICRPSCQHGGVCVKPNECDCGSVATGLTCQTQSCSYQRPCYPGDCRNDTCACETGFYMTNSSDGCININNTVEEFRPVITSSNVSIAHIRREDSKTQYMFTVLGRDENNFTLIWIDQMRFNYLRFEFDVMIDTPDMPLRPVYVHDGKIGVVGSSIEANLTKIPRDGSSKERLVAFNKTYECQTGISSDNPTVGKDTCILSDENFVTLIEHGDILQIKFQSRSGGYQKISNVDDCGRLFATKYYTGLKAEEILEFRFDFVTPTHCSEELMQCSKKLLHVANEFTSDHIFITWDGWTDALAGMWQYYVEIFKLTPNRDDRLVEAIPIDPVFHITMNHTAGIMSTQYTPDEPGMYSVLLKVSDMANNSRIARRFVLFDATPEITISSEPDKKLYISSAVKETGYAWQTPSVGDDKVTVNVRWVGHFANQLHEDGKFLAEIEKYPIQFKELEDDGILMSQKFVADSLDDNEGKRTRQAIPNYHGIVKYEVVYDQSALEQAPTIGWLEVDLSEQTSTQRILVDGDRLRVWVRATDVMGNTKTDSTFMRIDGSPPTISSGNSSDHQLQLNVADGSYSHSSRAMFLAADLQSGVHQIGIKLTVKSPGKDDIVTYQNFTDASRGENNEDPRCIGLDQNGVCLLPTQKVDIDNCWLTVSKEDLVSASGELEITAYNQAMLTATAVFDMGPLTELQGLEKYNGPTKMRIENKSPTGFRLAWDLPETESCYGKADIVIILTFKDSTGEIQIKSFETRSTASFFDFLGLDPEVEYNLGLQIKADGGTAQQFGEDLSVVTPKQENASAGVSTGAVAGMIVGLLSMCALVVLVLFVLTRRGIINVQPQRRMGEIRRAVTKRVRQSRMFAPETQGHSHENKVYAYDNRQSELYLYGGMDFNTSSKGYISRDQITFDVLLKSGHFANIYRARYNGQNVVAKTLKEHFTKDDELLMKAKVNFSSDRVGDHPNVIKFVGAIVDDVTMGPMIIYEFCENGTMKDYLVKNKSNMNVEMQENLFRFGLDIAKGMEFLASRGVTHRRLAARNILLNFMNEAKIAGFGPQSAGEEDGGDAETGKKERIPIKWVAPECMESTKKANERSDVWSYAVVLWEIFSLGETPYTGKSRDLPQRLKKGERLGKPELCDETWYKVMQKCWEFDSKKRPRFAEVREQLDALFVNSPGDDFYYYKR